MDRAAGIEDESIFCVVPCITAVLAVELAVFVNPHMLKFLLRLRTVDDTRYHGYRRYPPPPPSGKHPGDAAVCNSKRKQKHPNITRVPTITHPLRLGSNACVEAALGSADIFFPPFFIARTIDFVGYSVEMSATGTLHHVFLPLKSGK